MLGYSQEELIATTCHMQCETLVGNGLIIQKFFRYQFLRRRDGLTKNGYQARRKRTTMRIEYKLREIYPNRHSE